MHTSGHFEAVALLPLDRDLVYITLMQSRINQTDESQSTLLAEWRSLHPEFTDDEFDEAIVELRFYLRLAWAVYRRQHPDLDLPDEL